MPGGRIDAIAVGSPKNEGPALHGTIIGTVFDNCLSHRKVRQVIAKASVGCD